MERDEEDDLSSVKSTSTFNPQDILPMSDLQFPDFKPP
jgi:hypothetical protein